VAVGTRRYVPGEQWAEKGKNVKLGEGKHGAKKGTRKSSTPGGEDLLTSSGCPGGRTVGWEGRKMPSPFLARSEKSSSGGQAGR